MGALKVTVTKDKRKETIDKILNLIIEEYEGVELPLPFVRKLLQDSVVELEYRCILKN